MGDGRGRRLATRLARALRSVRDALRPGDAGPAPVFVALLCLRSHEAVPDTLHSALARQARGERWHLVELTATEAPGRVEVLLPDLVVVEVDSPEVAIEQSRELHARWPSARIVVVGNVGTPSQVAVALNAGADDVVRTAVPSEELLARIRRFARASATRGCEKET